MLTSIKYYLRSLGVDMILRSKVVEGIVNVLFFDYLGKDGRFYSLVVYFSETVIFSFNDNSTILIGEGKEIDNSANIRNAIERSLLGFEDKLEWSKGKYDLSIADKFNSVLLELLKVTTNNLVGVQYKEFIITKTCYWTKPFIGFTIYYSYKGLPQEALTFLLGNVLSIKNRFEGEPYESFKYFLESLGINRFYEWSN